MRSTLFIFVFPVVLLLSGVVWAEQRIDVPFFPDKQINVDGNLKDDEWAGAFETSDFSQTEPGENVPPTKKTFLKLFNNGKSLFAGIVCFDPHPKEIKRDRFRRDEVWDAERIEIGIDTYGNGKQMYVVVITPMNDVADGFYDLNIEQASLEIDLKFTSRAMINEWGWSLEVELPFASVNYPKMSSQCWGLYLKRYVPRQDMEVISLTPAVRESNNLSDMFAFLEMKNVELLKNKKINLLPAIFAESSKEQIQTGELEEVKDNNLQVGLTGEYAPASFMNMKFTVNPDFSQVEADYIQNRVNSRYPIYYNEKRPFFLDGMDSFRTPFMLVHTRTIVDPQAGLKFSLKSKKLGLYYIGAYENNVSGERFYGGLEGEKDVFWNIARTVYAFDDGSQLAAMFGIRNYGDLENYFLSFDGVNYIGKFYFSYQGVYSEKAYPDADRKNGSGGYVQGSYKWSKYLSTYLRYNFLSPDFRADTGFFYRTDYKTLNSGFTINWLPKASESFFKNIYLNFDYSLSKNYDGVKINDTPSLELRTELPQRINIFYFGKKDREEYLENIYDVNSHSINLKWQRYSLFEPWIAFSFGRGIVYNYENPRSADTVSLSGGASTSVKNFTIANSLIYERLREPDNQSLVSRQISLQSELYYFISPRLNVRLMLQHEIFRLNDYRLELPYTFLNFLFTYDHSAFSKVYFGITNKRNEYNYWESDVRFWQKEWMVFLKIQHLFSI